MAALQGLWIWSFCVTMTTLFLIYFTNVLLKHSHIPSFVQQFCILAPATCWVGLLVPYSFLKSAVITNPWQWNIPIYSFFYVHITSFQTSILSCSFKYIISAWEKKNVNKSFREQGIVTEVTCIGTLTPVRCIPYPLPYNIILMLSFVCGSFSL